MQKNARVCGVVFRQRQTYWIVLQEGSIQSLSDNGLEGTFKKLFLEQEEKRDNTHNFRVPAP